MALTISSGEISGHIPDQIGDLPDLLTLEFSDLTHLTGNIPRTITKFKNLEYLRLKKTSLSGPIPDYISELQNLSFLDLSFYQFTGPIPGSLSLLPILQSIQINDNKLTGSAPNSFSSFVDNVPNLYLFNNKLSGKIPESWAKYNFNAVDLSGNEFTGDGSMFFGRNKTTIRVNLSRNMFQFELSKVKFAKTIVSLDLSHNGIFGEFPRELTKLRLEHFNVSYNHLSGKIPSGGVLQTFEPSVYSHNICLCGAPQSHTHLLTMKLLHLCIFLISLSSSYSCTLNDKNALLQIKNSLNNPPLLSSWNPQTDCCTSWTGVACTKGRVAELTISSGKISGQIPAQIGDLPDLLTLEFSELTHLTGNIPRTITKLKNLEYLRLSENSLSGPIPSYISELKSVRFLDLSFNQFTGPIPGSISQMPNLEMIQLSDNKLTGSIPNSFGSFVGNVRSFYLFNNKLSGNIPESLSKYDFIAIDLSGNEFTGDGSMFFGRNKTTLGVNLSRNMFQFDLSKVKFARTIRTLDLSQNHIYGNFPKGLAKLRLERFNVSSNHLCGPIPQGGVLQTFKPSVYSHNICLCGPPLKPC
ncbi:hypothetical protein AALP_AAs71127U000100 [Arabis alpina]|uniref:Leucine-rich repeat-containing N-terminal plant-type domain-containing protein n=1 Tax=Arabis alpina TaxID=50452 RepID=A0A087G168_ARAAL|nr:hypothetical protein AALP_AAs71127U000100 [Arabis alpina]